MSIPVFVRNKPDPRPEIVTNDKYGKWKRNLFIGVSKHIIPRIEPGEDELGKQRAKMLVDEQRMPIWEQTLTDSAVSGKSYEPIETYGDGIVKPFVIKHALTTFPGIQPEEINNLVSHYVSNPLQGMLMKKFVITRRITGQAPYEDTFVNAYLLRADPKTNLVLTDAIYADLYEAMIGAICLAGDSITNGLGMVYAERWFNFIFVQNVVMEERYKYGLASSLAINLFNRFDFYHTVDADGSEHSPGKLIFTHQNMQDKLTTRSWVEQKVTFSLRLINFLNSLDKGLFPLRYKNKLPKSPGEIFVQAESDTKEEAREEAAAKALQKLKTEFGIDQAWISKVKNVLDKKAIEADPAFAASYRKAEAWVFDQGYKNMRFKALGKHSKEGNKEGIQIIVDDTETGYTEVVFSKLYEKGSRYVVRKDAIRDFVKQEGL